MHKFAKTLQRWYNISIELICSSKNFKKEFLCMSSYNQDDIKLQDAMTIALSQSVRIWRIPGFHVKTESLPQNATIQNTLVMLSSDGNWHAGLEWVVEGHSGFYMTSVLKCSSLQELLDKVPELFELE